MTLGIAGNLKKRPTSLPTRWPWLQTVVVQTRQLCTSRQRLRQSARHRPQKGVAHSWLAGMPSTQCDHQWGREAPNSGLSLNLFCGHCLCHSMVQQRGITDIAAKVGERQKDALRRENGVPDSPPHRGRGGTGRHTGLKILRGRPRAGSTPAVRTNFYAMSFAVYDQSSACKLSDQARFTRSRAARSCRTASEGGYKCTYRGDVLSGSGPSTGL